MVATAHVVRTIFISAIWLVGLVHVPAEGAEDASALLGDEEWRLMLRFFEYDRDVPLDPRIVLRSKTEGYVREKIVFTGARGDRVPAFLALPVEGKPPYPLVLALHGGDFSKESWWQADSFERGGALTNALLESGIAVLALDAQFHGERSVNNDYLPIAEMYFNHKWFARYRDLMLESDMDWRRALDYLADRSEIDLRRVGIVGYSMGGIMATHLAAVDSRINTVVLCVTALAEDWLFPLQAAQFAPQIGDARVLVLAGRSDELISVEDTQRLYGLFATENKELRFYDSGHKLPEEYVEKAVAWLRAGLLDQPK